MSATSQDVGPSAPPPPAEADPSVVSHTAAARRNICLLSAVDHGSTSVLDTLFSSRHCADARVYCEVEGAPVDGPLDLRTVVRSDKSLRRRYAQDEVERCITLRNSVHALTFSDLAIGAEKAPDAGKKEKQGKEDVPKGTPEDVVDHIDYLFAMEAEQAGGSASAAPPEVDDDEPVKTEAPPPIPIITTTSLDLCVIDTPGHVDFASETSTSLRLVDGAILTIDIIEGLNAHAARLLRLATREGVRVILLLNKLDRAILELQLSPDETYGKLCRVIDAANECVGKVDQFGALNGNVAFGSSLRGWAFDLSSFATADTVPKQKLWGDHFYNPETKSWQEHADPGKKLKNGFCTFCLLPIWKIHQACMDGQLDEVTSAMRALGEDKLMKSEKELRPKMMLSSVMSRLLPMSDVLLRMSVLHLPSPDESQRDRVSRYYEGDLSDAFAVGMRACDAEGPLVVDVVAFRAAAPTDASVVSIGRVLSGTLRGSTRVRLVHRKVEGQKITSQTISTVVEIGKVGVMCGLAFSPREAVVAGQICAIMGADAHLLVGGTLCGEDDVSCAPIRVIRRPTAVVGLAVEPSSPKDLPTFLRSLQRLKKSDPSCVVEASSSTGELCLSGLGELHLEILLKQLREEYCKDTPFRLAAPWAVHFEVVTAESDRTCLSKSPNKHCRLFMEAEPIESELLRDLEKGVGEKDISGLGDILIDKYRWDPRDAVSLWDMSSSNLLVNMTKGVQYLDEIRESVQSGFTWCVAQGILCDEKLRGVRFNLIDTTLHADAIHRGPGQIIPTARRAFRAAQYTARPTLAEAIYDVEISCPESVMGAVYTVLSQKRGVLTSQKADGPLVFVAAELPASESFGFMNYLRSRTAGQAFAQCFFKRWQPRAGFIIPGDDAHNAAQPVMRVISAMRRRRGLRVELPPLSRYMDRL